MQAHPDKKLKELVESKDGDYQADAVAAAEEILISNRYSAQEP
jgi:hypothetical protein